MECPYCLIEPSSNPIRVRDDIAVLSPQGNPTAMVEHRMFRGPVKAVPKRVPASCRAEGLAPDYAPQQVD